MQTSTSPADPTPADARGASARSASEMTTETTQTAAELAEARRYGRLELTCDLGDKALDVVFLGCFAWFAAVGVERWLVGQFANVWVQWGGMYLIVVGLHTVISFPLSLYSGHVLERQFGLSTLSLGGWLRRYLKRNLLGLAFGLATFMALFALLRTAGPWWWVAAAGAGFVVSVVLSQLVPVVILPLFYKIERLDLQSDRAAGEGPEAGNGDAAREEEWRTARELCKRLERLSSGTGLNIAGVYRMELSAETVKANAMLAGLGRTRRVILGDTLLAGFSADELEVIFAHEIGHHVHRHIAKLIALGGAFMAAGFWACDGALRLWGEQIAPPFEYGTIGPSALPVLMLALTVFSLLLEPLQNVVSRAFERQCDWYALQATQRPDAYRSAFAKLAKLNKDDPNPNAMATFLFHSHPPIAERLAMANDFLEGRGEMRAP